MERALRVTLPVDSVCPWVPSSVPGAPPTPIGLAPHATVSPNGTEPGGSGGGADDLTHDAVVLALGALVGEAGLLVHAAGGVIEERGRDLLARRVLRVALDDSAAGLGDQVQGPAEGDGGHSLAPVVAR